VMSSGQSPNFKGYTPTRYYPSSTSEPFSSASINCVPWKEQFDCTWRADLRVLMLRDLTAGRYGFQHHRISSRLSASASKGGSSVSTGSSFYGLIYHIDMDVEMLKKVADDPNGVLDDPDVPTLFEVFECMRIWICLEPEAKHEDVSKQVVTSKAPSGQCTVAPDDTVPSKEDSVDEMETITPIQIVTPRHSPKRRRSTLSTSYSPSSPRLLSYPTPNSPLLTRPQLHRRKTSSATGVHHHLSSSRKRLSASPKSGSVVCSSPYTRSSVLYAKDYMRWMLGGFTRVMSGASLTLGGVVDNNNNRGTAKLKRGRITAVRRMSASGWNRPLVVTA